MRKLTKHLLPLAILSGVSSLASAATYTYEISDTQTWSDAGSTETSTQYARVRAYVPGSRSINYTTVPIYTGIYSSAANALGDVVGSVSNIYGTSPAWVDPYDEGKYSIMYPTYDVMRTRLATVNDERLAIGSYVQLGGRTTSFIYDLIYKQYTELHTPDGASAAIVDLNNSGQVIGTHSSVNGTVPFTYDCINGFEDFTIPEATSVSVRRIDDAGNIYGRVYGVDEALTYFIATPDLVTDTSTCSLVSRDDVADPVNFVGGTNFEMSGDVAQAVKVGDFNGGGVDDIYIYHEMGKYILYIGEGGFKDKDKNFSDWNTVEQDKGVELATEWDFNNDGLPDKVDGNKLYLAKSDTEYYYVPQILSAGSRSAYGDFNGDGLLDVASFGGAFVSVVYQADAAASGYEPAPEPELVPEPAPDVVDPVPADSGSVPVVDVEAQEVEMKSTIAEVRNDSVLLSSGNVLWFNAETIIKYNDASAFEVGQSLEFKAWLNPDGALVGIKVEIAE